MENYHLLSTVLGEIDTLLKEFNIGFSEVEKNCTPEEKNAFLELHEEIVSIKETTINELKNIKRSCNKCQNSVMMI